jgi:uncharacterized protein
MQDDNVQIIANKPTSENPLLIEGFPGVGLVGNIASQYMVHQLDMTYLGAIDSRFFPPVTVMLQGVAKMPVRIYEKAELDLIVITSDVPIHPVAAYDVGRELVAWADLVNIRELVCLAGMEILGEEQRVFGAVTSKDLLSKLKDVVEIFEVGSVSGISGSIMNECLLKNIPAICLLGETHGKAPNPRAAAATLDMLNKLYNLGVDITRLEEEAEQIELQMHQLAEQVKTTVAEEPPAREFPMYG